MQKSWPGDRTFPLAQLVRLVEELIRSHKIAIAPALYRVDAPKRRLVITLNMTTVVQHTSEAIQVRESKQSPEI